MRPRCVHFPQMLFGWIALALPRTHFRLGRRNLSAPAVAEPGSDSWFCRCWLTSQPQFHPNFCRVRLDWRWALASSLGVGKSSRYVVAQWEATIRSPSATSSQWFLDIFLPDYRIIYFLILPGLIDWSDPNFYKSLKNLPRVLSCFCFNNIKTLGSTHSCHSGFLA